MWWFLTREVLRLKGSISRDIPWDVVPDLFFYRDPEDVRLQSYQINDNLNDVCRLRKKSKLKQSKNYYSNKTTGVALLLK